MIKIVQGQIWEVISDRFLTSGKHHAIARQVKLDSGEKIEIRFEYEWHFRTEDNTYFHAPPEMILTNCRLIGKVLEEVSWHNIAHLDEIIRLHLYKEIK